MKLLEILGVLGLNIDFYGLKAFFTSGYLPTTNGGKVKNSLNNNMKKNLFTVVFMPILHLLFLMISKVVCLRVHMNWFIMVTWNDYFLPLNVIVP